MAHYRKSPPSRVSQEYFFQVHSGTKLPTRIAKKASQNRFQSNEMTERTFSRPMMLETEHQRLSRESPDRFLFLLQSLMIYGREWFKERYGRRGYPFLRSLRLFDNLP